MIRISFETQTNSEDPDHPEAWRPEAAAVLEEVARRIRGGETMPLRLMDAAGNPIGRARELSYSPEPPRKPGALTSRNS